MSSSIPHFLCAATLLAGGLACSSDESGPGDESEPTCEEDTRDETYVAGINKVGPANYKITLMDSNPAPPAKGDNVWTIEVRDGSDAPVTGLDISTTQFMPDHGHGSPIIAGVSEVGDGVYTLDPVNLFMPGYWETTLTAIDPGATDSPDDDTDLDSVMFKFCIDG